MRRYVIAVGLTAWMAASAARADTLVFNADTSDPAPRAAFADVVKRFEAAHPGTNVQYNVYDHESYKQAIRNWLTSEAPDVVLWYTGERLRQFVRPGLIADVSMLFTPASKQALGSTAVDLVTNDGKQYGVPYSEYQWGLYERSDLLKKAGVAPISDWRSLVAACDTLKHAGVAPFVIGTKDLWPTAGWFDYLDLRLNGYAFHMQLMSGHTSYLDPKVKNVMSHWKQLIDDKCFNNDQTELGFQESQSLLFQGRGAIMLIGNFVTQSIPPAEVENINFQQFPTLDASVKDAEDAPMEDISIPAHAHNIKGAQAFLAFVMQPDTQTAINRIEHQIPINSASSVGDDKYLVAGRALLAATKDHAQFMDRDTSEDLATIAMKGFAEFMVRPGHEDQILATIERARKRIYSVD